VEEDDDVDVLAEDEVSAEEAVFFGSTDVNGTVRYIYIYIHICLYTYLSGKIPFAALFGSTDLKGGARFLFLYGPHLGVPLPISLSPPLPLPLSLSDPLSPPPPPPPLPFPLSLSFSLSFLPPPPLLLSLSLSLSSPFVRRSLQRKEEMANQEEGEFDEWEEENDKGDDDWKVWDINRKNAPQLFAFTCIEFCILLSLGVLGVLCLGGQGVVFFFFGISRLLCRQQPVIKGGCYAIPLTVPLCLQDGEVDEDTPSDSTGQEYLKS
jgi:hypothetical protein